MAGIAGFEPTNTTVKVWCLTAWRYPYGVNDGTRTHDNQCHKLALYQLNYVHHNGAGSGNRTHLSSLEGWSITDIRYPQIIGAC